jgi:hypothetical protein
MQTDTDFFRQLHTIENNYLLLRTIYAGALPPIHTPCTTGAAIKTIQQTDTDRRQTQFLSDNYLQFQVFRFCY